MRQSILKKAFEGKLVEQWPDLPAPEVIAQDIAENLEAALEQFSSIHEDLGTD